MPSDDLPVIEFAQEYAEPILAGEKTVTFRRHRNGWVRVPDGLSAGNRVRLATTNGNEIDTATIVTRLVVPAWQLARLDIEGHRSYADYNELGRDLERHYEDWTVGSDTSIEVLAFLPDQVAHRARANDERRYGVTETVDDHDDESTPEVDPQIRCDGGAIDNDFDDAEGPPAAQMADELEEERDGAPVTPTAGDVAVDLLTHQPVYIEVDYEQNVVQYYDETGFNLMAHKANAYLQIQPTDLVVGAVYIGSDPQSLHKPGKIYPMPVSRLARIPTENATSIRGDDQ
jgi:hypothetical protein